MTRHTFDSESILAVRAETPQTQPYENFVSHPSSSTRIMLLVSTREDFEELRTFGMWGHRPARQASLRSRRTQDLIRAKADR
jgi:hypothetical protein